MLSLGLTACLWAAAQPFADYAASLADHLVEPGRFEPLPRADQAFWHDSVPLTMRQSYIRYGEQYLGRPWPALPVSVFAEFKENGNRTRYEQLCFDRRRQLAAHADPRP